MAFTASTDGLLEKVEKFVAAHLEANWAAEPNSSRLALLVREELRRWTQSRFPGASCEGSTLDSDSRRRLSLVIHSANVTHRVEIWGIGNEDTVKGAGPHTAHSWVVLAGTGTAFRSASEHLEKAGLKKVEQRDAPAFSLSLWMGTAAPDGCPECAKKK